MLTTGRRRLLGCFSLLFLAALVTPTLLDGTARADAAAASKQLFMQVIGHHRAYRAVINPQESVSHRS
ncbi:hypothetical protein OG535_07165 [Kitasatospora sp. NBC_00085]|uniref:hypothetical protein n=1 Tax=unclassified Kitasatospora TaxID=2633591 RepID=UPI0032537EFD